MRSEERCRVPERSYKFSILVVVQVYKQFLFSVCFALSRECSSSLSSKRSFKVHSIPQHCILSNFVLFVHKSFLMIWKNIHTVMKCNLFTTKPSILLQLTELDGLLRSDSGIWLYVTGDDQHPTSRTNLCSHSFLSLIIGQSRSRHAKHDPTFQSSRCVNAGTSLTIIQAYRCNVSPYSSTNGGF